MRTLTLKPDPSRLTRSHRAVQTKLVVNKPGDVYEQEADRVSEQVLRTPEPRVQRHCACGGACSKCQEDQEPLQTKRLQGGEPGPRVAPAGVHDVLAAPGHALDAETRGFMESRFGHDLGHIRVHTDRRASESARTLRAQAYTVGRDIVFGEGEYAPRSEAGRRLLAHELTHTLQQGAGRSGILQRQPKPKEAEEERCPLGEMRMGPGLPCFPFTWPGRDCPAGQVRLSKDAPCIPWRERRPTLLDAKLKLDPIFLPGKAPAGTGTTGGTTGTGTTTGTGATGASAAGCSFTITYANPVKLDCDTIWRNTKGTTPPKGLCGAGIQYDIVSVSTSGKDCPAKLEGLKVSETVKGDRGCTPPGFKWPLPNPCTIGPGGKLTGCTDTYSLCGPASELKFGGCTEVLAQDILVDGKVADKRTITFDLDTDDFGCRGTVTRK